MFKKKEMIAMLLAGGQGSRLYTLTETTAKPAVPFGGKYRIIDFALSNCINSGIDTVGVLTQYQPLVLNEYIGNGGPWDMDRTFGGVKILPPYQGKTSDWYRGTANAIYQNINFIRRYDPEYVVILSGDHIYKMDYSKMLEYHKTKEADCTVAVIDVSLEEAKRFGIMTLDDNYGITEFHEKPQYPNSTKASMGIYIFNTKKLIQYLTQDEEDPSSSNDFGKNIIPNMLNSGEKMFAYQFEGYWKDVGTIDSLWSANMDLLGETPEFNLNDRQWKIYSRPVAEPPQFVSEESTIKNSIVTEGCRIYGTVENSILFNGVVVERGAVIKDSIIMEHTVIDCGATVDYAIVDSYAQIGKNAKVGEQRSTAEKITVLGSTAEIAPGAVIRD